MHHATRGRPDHSCGPKLISTARLACKCLSKLPDGHDQSLMNRKQGAHWASQKVSVLGGVLRCSTTLRNAQLLFVRLSSAELKGTGGGLSQTSQTLRRLFDFI